MNNERVGQEKIMDGKRYVYVMDEEVGILRLNLVGTDGLNQPLREGCFRCKLCDGPVDRFLHVYQCRKCHAIGDLITGFMSPTYEQIEAWFQPKGGKP